MNANCDKSISFKSHWSIRLVLPSLSILSNHCLRFELHNCVMSAPTYNLFQQIFELSLISNGVHTRKGTQTQLVAWAQQYLQPTINQFNTDGKLSPWNVVWGPMVWKNDDVATTGPDNTMFVANCSDIVFPDGTTHNVYVVAIAGTATTSAYDWTGEDLAVTSVVDFEDWYASWPTTPGTVQVATPAHVVANPGKPYITEGVADGIYPLITQASPLGSHQTGTTIRAFLAGIPKDAYVIFTGHSLGGALSPTLALGLVGSGMLSKVVEGGKVYTYPTAGFSPGNKGFNKSYSDSFPFSVSSAGYQAFNGNYFNTLDVVPQVWCQDKSLDPAQNITNIPTLWGETPMEADILRLAVDRYLLARANLSPIKYLPLAGNFFTAPMPTFPFPPFVLNPVEYAALIKAWIMACASQEHVENYISQFDITRPPTPTSSGKKIELVKGVTKKTEEEIRNELPILRALGTAGLMEAIGPSRLEKESAK
ncbi:hypothetical protein FRB94_005148 [Tulasnella sp. JGI-2019a]|nr:hypothetical protein FRB94_005148 [Tulasnella sp. JGI-2019a]